MSAIVEDLSHSTWPEMVECWSRLTPTGFPVELTITDADRIARWTTEIAGPEIDDSRRLGLVAARLATAGQTVATPLLDAIELAQRGRQLCYGAWIGIRTASDAPLRYKLYAEVPLGVPLQEFPLPLPLTEAAAHAPHAAVLRMIGVEPASDRIEIYLRLPIIEPDDLRPLLIACGHSNGLDLLERSLPDGTQRLAARRLGFSISASRNSLAVALFASARSLFPGSPEMLRKLIPAMALIPPVLGWPTLVTIRLNSETESVSFAAGVTINSGRDFRSDRRGRQHS